MNEFEKDRSTSEQLVELLDNEQDITICSDVVHGLYHEYKHLQEENQKSKEEKQELIDYLKEKKEEYIKLYNISCDIIEFDRYECLKILCEEILSKIEKSDK